METEGESVTVRDGNTRNFYRLVNGVFVPETGDYSILTKYTDNTYGISSTDGAKKKFSASGRIISATDINGNTLAFAYDASGNLVSVADIAARTIAYAYDSNNRLISIIDPAGKQYSFTYSGNLLAAVTWPDGSSWQYTYDSKGFMMSKTDPLGTVTTYAYDEKHRVTQGSDLSGTVTVAHSSATSIIKSSDFTEENGGVWNYTYDSHDGLLTRKTDPLGNGTAYAYDTNRNLIQEIAPNSTATSYSFDAAGNMLSKTDAWGMTTTYTYNSLGEVTSSTDPLGQTSTSSYDDKGKLTQKVDPLGAKTTYNYDGKGNMTSVTSALNQTSTFAYDTAGNQISSTDPTGTKTTFAYDAMGNLLSQTDSLGKTTAYEYDDRYRIAKMTDPLGNVTGFAYDLKGNKISETDANGNITRHEYDTGDHLIKTVDAMGSVTTYTYGSTGCTSCSGGTAKLTNLTDAKGQSTNYQYDLLGRLIKETDPLGMAISYVYDAVGNRTYKTDANGATIHFIFDARNQLRYKVYPDGSREIFTYDDVGRIAAAENADVSYTYAYDAAGRITSVKDSRGYTIAYSYDLQGNRERMILQPGAADERVTSYAYDAAGRLTGITSSAGTFTYGYDALGRRVSLSYPNQIIANYSYDSAGRVTSLHHGNVASFTYTIDKVGNRTGKTFTETEQYFYDTIYRLLTVTSTKPESFSYDEVGNRLTGPGAKDTSYLYNSGNQMVRGRKNAYSYDNNGHQISRTIPAASDKSWMQTWDYENRLVKVEKMKGAEKRVVNFSYDPHGRRIGKQVVTVIDGVTKTLEYAYLYDNDNIILESLTDDRGTVKTVFTHGGGVDEHLARERDGQVSYYHADGLGSVVALTDQRKRVVQSYEYDSFGIAKPSSSSFVNSYTYTGREWDKETGLYYYRARYYDPMEGRFLSKDPIGFKGGSAVLYGYVSDNSVNDVDPSGLGPIGRACGSGWSEFLVPDNLFGWYNFNSPCQNHDRCYDNCDKTKEQCDSEFLKDLLKFVLT